MKLDSALIYDFNKNLNNAETNIVSFSENKNIQCFNDFLYNFELLTGLFAIVGYEQLYTITNSIREKAIEENQNNTVISSELQTLILNYIKDVQNLINSNSGFNIKLEEIKKNYMYLIFNEENDSSVIENRITNDSPAARGVSVTNSKSSETAIHYSDNDSSLNNSISGTQNSETKSEIVVATPDNDDSEKIDDEAYNNFLGSLENYGPYLNDFIDETQEILTNLDKGLLMLESNPNDADLLNEIFRYIHTIKGNSATLEIKIMNIVAHRAESLLDKVRKKILPLNTDIIDIMLECMGIFKAIVEKIQTGKNELIIISDTVKKLNILSVGGTISVRKDGKIIIPSDKKITSEEELKTSANTISPAASSIPETIQTEKKDMVQETHKESAASAPKELKNKESREQTAKSKTQSNAAHVKKEENVRVEISKLNSALNLIGEIVIDKIRLKQNIQKMSDFTLLIDELIGGICSTDNINTGNYIQISIEDRINNYIESISIDSEFHRFYKDEFEQIKFIVNNLKTKNIFNEDDVKKQNSDEVVLELRRISAIFSDSINRLLLIITHLNSVTNDLQESLMKMRMVPVSQLFDKVPLIVRTLSRELNKLVKIEMHGAETELDKTVIELLNDPIMHIIRNSIDHGIEFPDERIKNNKPEEGSILLSAEHKGNQVVISISDNGKGINTEAVLKKAIDSKLITYEKSVNMKKADILELIFLPGFSSAEKVTEISGRGVGMDVVLSNIKKLKGTVEIDTDIGKGTNIIIRLPLTLSIMLVQLIKCGNQSVAIPINFIDEIITLNSNSILHIGNNRVFNLRDEMVPLLSLNKILGVGTSDFFLNNGLITIAIINIADNKIGLIIDGLEGQQEIVIKSLGSLLKNVPHISGATILGEGNVVLILDMLSIYTTIKRSVDFSIDIKSEYIAKVNLTEAETTDSQWPQILIVDDSSTMRAALKDNIKEGGYYNTTEAADGMAALELIQNKHFDLITVDVIMPGMNGYELVKKIREIPSNSRVPVIMVSSKSDQIDKMRGFDAGADEYITKPYNKSDIIKAVDRYLKK